MALVVRVKKKELLGFEKARDDLNYQQRALLQRLRERGAGEDIGEIDLSCFVLDLDAHESIAELQRQLEAVGGGLVAAVMDELQALEQTSTQRADAPAGSLPHGGGGAPRPGHSRPPADMPPPRPEKHAAPQGGSKPKPVPKAAVPASVVPEQIQVKRETTIIMRA
jgi:hypothetical protein